MEETRQRYEGAANLQRAKAEVERQKRYLEQLERDEQYAGAKREDAPRPSRYWGGGGYRRIRRMANF